MELAGCCAVEENERTWAAQAGKDDPGRSGRSRQSPAGAGGDHVAMTKADDFSMAGAPRQPTVSLDHAGAMPLVGLGTGTLTGRQCYQAVRYALEVGYRHLDSATMYVLQRT
jgi:hypothetical protein